MMKWISLICLGLALTVVTASNADETKSKSKGKGRGSRGPTATQRVLGKVEITDAQKEQVAAIDKEFADELATLNKARTAILTPDQIKAEKEAQAANKGAGKTGSEARKGVEAAINLTDEQKTKMKEWQKSQTEFNTRVAAALKKVLTPEQQEKLVRTGGAKGKKKKKAQS